MAILKVANIHFDAAGTNRLDYLNDGTLRSTSNIRITNATTNPYIFIGEGTGINDFGSMSWDRTKNKIVLNGGTGGLTLAANNQEGISLVVSPGGYANVDIRTYDFQFSTNTAAFKSTTDFQFRTIAETFDPANLAITSTGNVTIGRTESTVGQRVKLDVNGAANTSDILVNGVSVSPLGQQTIWVPAVAMYGRLTNGAASGTLETSTNRVMIRTLDFDTTTQEFAQFAIQMPKSWNESSLVCQFVWSHATTTTNFGVTWQIQAVALANADALDSAFSSNVAISDTGGTANTIYISEEASGVTVAGSPSAEEYIVFQVGRFVANTSDTLAVDARLHGVKIHYTIDAAKDD